MSQELSTAVKILPTYNNWGELFSSKAAFFSLQVANTTRSTATSTASERVASSLSCSSTRWPHTHANTWEGCWERTSIESHPRYKILPTGRNTKLLFIKIYLFVCVCAWLALRFLFYESDSGKDVFCEKTRLISHFSSYQSMTNTSWLYFYWNFDTVVYWVDTPLHQSTGCTWSELKHLDFLVLFVLFCCFQKTRL